MRHARGACRPLTRRGYRSGGKAHGTGWRPCRRYREKSARSTVQTLHRSVSSVMRTRHASARSMDRLHATEARSRACSRRDDGFRPLDGVTVREWCVDGFRFGVDVHRTDGGRVGGDAADELRAISNQLRGIFPSRWSCCHVFQSRSALFARATTVGTKARTGALFVGSSTSASSRPATVAKRSTSSDGASRAQYCQDPPLANALVS